MVFELPTLHRVAKAPDAYGSYCVELATSWRFQLRCVFFLANFCSYVSQVGTSCLAQLINSVTCIMPMIDGTSQDEAATFETKLSCLATTERIRSQTDALNNPLEIIMTFSLYVLNSHEDLIKVQHEDLNFNCCELKFTTIGEYKSYLLAVELITRMGAKSAFEIRDVPNGISVRNLHNNEYHSVPLVSEFERIAYRRGIIDTRASDSIQLIAQDNPMYSTIKQLLQNPIETSMNIFAVAA